MEAVHTFKWTGDEKAYLNEIHVEKLGPLSIGLYGGNTEAGASTNEDAVLAWCDPQRTWEFVMIFDAQSTIERAKLIIDIICKRKEKLLQLFTYPSHLVFHHTHMYLLSLFTDEKLIEESERIQGQISCLICLRKGKFVYWLSVGECFVYLFHPRLLQCDQGRLNKRQCYERIGRKNIFSAGTPCFTSGVRELQEGINHIVMATDGIMEYGERIFEDDHLLYQSLYVKDSLHVGHVLDQIDYCKKTESATIIGWSIDIGDIDCTCENN
ncbi:protein phosphatase 2C domain-containing protein [Bacillus sp. CGMCC 1.60114]|uniref:protein phosphatase 2C domain-containing protein n=1 Tax=unclassified Bacillus (in: firmicutes) TaxID=185979 RepID=UPI00362EC39F